MTEYEKELNHLKERILKDGDTLVSKRDLLERFCEVDKEYDGSPWNLLQILTNIHILIGEERESFKNAYIQVVKERDIAIGQLNELGYSLGEKIRYCEDCVSREAVNELFDSEIKVYEERIETRKGSNYHDEAERIKEFRSRIANAEYWQDKIKELPSVVPKSVTVTDFADKCRKCGKLMKKYNEKN